MEDFLTQFFKVQPEVAPTSKKDLVKTSGGKYVAPQHIEGKIKATCPLVSQALVHGNNRNFCTALITLDEEAAKGWAAAHGHASKSAAELAALDAMKGGAAQRRRVAELMRPAG